MHSLRNCKSHKNYSRKFSIFNLKFVNFLKATMPEGEVTEKKRGRQAAAAKEDKVNVIGREIKSNNFLIISLQSESKKRAHDPSPKSADESVPENGSEPKRGRGRPKGSKKANAKPKKAPVPGRGRGRPKASSNDEATGSD